MSKKLNVAVFAGGLSSEREVSLKSGDNVVRAIEELGHTVRRYDPATDLKRIIEDKDWIQVVFPVLHGKYGEDGSIQGFCELLELPYVGSGILASALAMNKVKTLEIYKLNGLPVAKSRELSGQIDLDKLENEIGFPCVMKPINNGSSIGVEIILTKDDFRAAYERVKNIESSVMVEEYVKGREITVGVIGNENPKALPILEIKPKNNFFDYEAKYNGETKEEVVRDLNDEIKKAAQDYAIKAHKALGCRGLSRTDMILRNQEIVLLETNTMPGMTNQSLLPKADQAAGVSFNQLIERLLQLALEGKDGVCEK